MTRAKSAVDTKLLTIVTVGAKNIVDSQLLTIVDVGASFLYKFPFLSLVGVDYCRCCSYAGVRPALMNFLFSSLV